MGTRLYVGNLPYSTDDKQLRAVFEEIGQQPREVRIITDRMTGQSRGFAFVEVNDAEAAQACISALHGKPFGGRTLTVNEARERDAARPPGNSPRSPGGGGGGYPPRDGGPPRSFGGGPPRSFGGPPRGGFGGGPGRPGGGDRNAPSPDRDRDRDRFERKKQKRRRDDYGDDDGY
jgi:RNA recognition motif-containing protein